MTHTHTHTQVLLSENAEEHKMGISVRSRMLPCLLLITALCYYFGPCAAEVVDQNEIEPKKENGGSWNTTDLDIDKIKEGKKNMRKYSSYNDEMFTFGTFENFELTRDVFRDEVQFVRELKQLRILLQRSKEQLLQGELSSTATATATATIALRDVQMRLNNISSRFPEEEDFEGALRGLVFLQDTYRFNLIELSKGRLVSKDYPRGPLALDNDHHLVLDDFYRLTKLSFAFKWYDRASEFLQVAFKLLEGETRMKADMVKMRKNLMILNNQNLFKLKRSVTGEMKIHPFEIGDSLRRKKKQPDYVREVTTSDRISRNGREDHFRQACNGLVTNKTSSSELQCGLLHHRDPYLKLGPFKIEMSSQSPMVMVFHDFFTEAEMEFLVEHSRPKLSRKRYSDPYNDAIDLGLRKTKKVTRIIHKSVQYWIKELEYDKYYDNLHELETNDSYTIRFPSMFRLTQKIELATSLNATAKYAATDYQTTNYG